MSTGIPISCTLAPRAFIDRVAWVKRLNEASLRRYQREGLILHLTYAPDALEQVRDLAEWEQECCPFLRFTVDERPEAVGLSIEAPPEASGAAGILFAGFLAGARPGTEAAGTADAISRAAGRAAVISAGVALACGVCWVVPLAVPAVAVTAVGSAMAIVAGAFQWARVAAVVLVGAGWLWLLWRSLRLRRWPSAGMLSAMVVGTVLLGLALKWPLLERHVMRALTGG